MTPTEPYLLAVSQLSLSMSGQQLLNAVDLNIQEGQRIAILGANGAGKTTLLRCLLAVSYTHLTLPTTPYV